MRSFFVWGLARGFLDAVSDSSNVFANAPNGATTGAEHCDKRGDNNEDGDRFE